MLTILTFSSCTKFEDEKAVSLPTYGRNDPPPPPSPEMLKEIESSAPPLVEYLNALQSVYRKEGKSEQEINAKINEFKRDVQQKCPPCFETVKDYKSAK